jgi:hypothetical protein
MNKGRFLISDKIPFSSGSRYSSFSGDKDVMSGVMFKIPKRELSISRHLEDKLDPN